MYVNPKSHVLFLVTIVLTIHTTTACKGCVELDEITFRRVPLKFNYSLIKFDIAFPYGDKHEAFSQLALQLQTVPPLVDDLLFGLVGIKDYGDKDNADLAEKYKIDDKAYPAILLFDNDLDKEIARFPASLDVTLDNLKEFVRKNSKLYIGLPGCIYEYDMLVRDFPALNKLEKENVLQKAIELIKLNQGNQNYTTTANMYTLYIQKFMDRGEGFLKDESERLEKLLKKGKISDKKKNELETKINVLKSFENKDGKRKNKEIKEEL